MKKIMIYTNHFEPEQFKINDIALDLSKDNKVEVITQIPNYPKGKWFRGYGLFSNRKERINENLTVRRLFSIPRGNNKLLLLINYVSYVISCYIFSLFHRYEKVDEVLIYSTSPIFISWPGIRHAKKQKANLTMYLLDLWPDNLISILKIKNKTIIKLLDRICMNIYKKMDLIWISSLGFEQKLINFGVRKQNIQLLPQHEIIPEKSQRNYQEKDVLEVVFTGNVGEGQGLELLVDLCMKMRDVKDHFIHFTIVGDGRFKAKLEKIIKKESLGDYIALHPRVPKEDLVKYYNNADYGLVILKDDDAMNKHLPAKVQSYMAYGVPILGIVRDETQRVVEGVDCGIIVNQKPVDQIYTELKEKLVTSPKKLKEFSNNAYEYALSNYEFTHVMETIRHRLIREVDAIEDDKISIIMPLYNAEKFVGETLDSILNQSYHNFEILIVDDISTDNSYEIIKAYMEKDNRIKYYQLETKGGASVARNFALKKARGEFVAFLDADDLWDEDKLEKQVKFMKDNNYAFSYTNYRLISESSRELLSERKANDKINYIKSLFVSSLVGCLTVMYNQKIIGEIQIRPIKKRNDIAMWQKILRKGYKGYLLDETLASHREVKGSLSRRGGKVGLIKYHYKLYRDNLGFNPISSSFFMSANMVSYLWIRLTQNN